MTNLMDTTLNLTRLALHRYLLPRVNARPIFGRPRLLLLSSETTLERTQERAVIRRRQLDRRRTSFRRLLRILGWRAVQSCLRVGVRLGFDRYRRRRRRRGVGRSKVDARDHRVRDHVARDILQRVLAGRDGSWCGFEGGGEARGGFGGGEGGDERRERGRRGLRRGLSRRCAEGLVPCFERERVDCYERKKEVNIRRKNGNDHNKR